MANTFETYLGDGATNLWSVPFAYLAKEHVHVYIDDVEDVTFSWVTDSSVAASSIPANGATVLVKRITPRDELTVVIPNAGTLRGKDINSQSLQALYVAEEAYDALSDIMKSNSAGTAWDADERRIMNLADPINDQDAATKKWVDDKTAASVLAAASSALSASGSADVAGEKADTATTQASLAVSAKNAAQDAKVAAEAALDSFDDRYLGSKTSDPTLDNDGNTLLTGALYWNSVNSVIKVYNGSSWSPIVLGAAGSVTVTPSGNLTATNVQDALIELDSDLSDAVSALSLAISGKVSPATTLAGYGITDAYTKTEVDSALSGKAPTNSPTFSGSIIQSGSQIVFDRPAATIKSIVWKTSGLNRWVLQTNTNTETGGNAGADLVINCHNDDGTYLRTLLTAVRATGRLNLGLNPDVGGNRMGLPTAILAEQQASGTDGGTFTSGARRTRTLNTAVRLSGPILTLSSNQFTLLAAGDYYIEWSAPAYSVTRHMSWLRNVSDGVDVASSATAFALASASGFSVSEGAVLVSIAASKTFSIEHQCSATKTTDGFGIASSLGTETYTVVKIWKV